MGFYDNMQSQMNKQKTVTTNGAVAYRSSGKELLDFNFAVSAMRNVPDMEIYDDFMSVFFEDRLRAVQYAFYLGDVREGIGERKAFRACLAYLINEQTDIAKKVMPLVPFYNRWDSILLYLDLFETKHEVAMFIKKQLKQDKRDAKAGKPISLCAKWMPSINASSDKARLRARILCSEFGWTLRKYRKTLAKLRKYLDVTEVKMSGKKWGEINYETVPSKANLIYNGAFLRNDEARRREYLDSLSKGDVKINASTLNPHEICLEYRTRTWNNKGVDATLEALWKALPNLSVENTLIVRDGSGSMTWNGFGGNATPLDVATALAIYMAEHNTGGWKDKFVTFSANPKIVDLSNCKTLKDKVALSIKEADCSNTDIYKTMKLILDTAVYNKMSAEEMPKMIVICSDMQFDGRKFNFTGSLFDNIAKMFKEAGYQMPRICFWNLNGAISKTVPMQKNESGLILCSGFSVQILKMFMSNQVDPYKVLLETLDSERYKPIKEIVGDLL